MHDLKDRVAFVSGVGSVGPGWGNGKATAVFLASDEARYITATHLTVDGGLTAGRADASFEKFCFRR